MKARSWHKIWYTWGIRVLFLLLLAGGVYEGKNVKAALLGVISPFVRMAKTTGDVTANVLQVLFQSSSRVQEIRRLRVENQAIKARAVLQEHLEKENQELRAALERETEDMQFLYARVVGVSPAAADGYVVVDAGQRNGVEVDMKVLVGGTVYIGSVAEVAARSATVRLLSHTGEKIQVYLPEARVSSVAVGQGGGILEIQVPASISVREGEALLSVGPPDFLVGYVEHVEKSDAAPFQKIRTSHPFSLADMQNVFLLSSH